MRFIQLTLALSTFVLLSLFSIGQDSFPDFTLPCDSVDYQSGMNMCAHKKLQLVDSVMNVKYQSILETLRSDIENYELEKDLEMINYTEILWKSGNRHSKSKEMVANGG